MIDLGSVRYTSAASAGSYSGVDARTRGSVEVPTAEEAEWSTHSADQAPDLRRRAAEIETEAED